MKVQNQTKTTKEIEQIIETFLEDEFKKLKSEIDLITKNYCKKYSVDFFDSKKEMEAVKGLIGMDFLLDINQNEEKVDDRIIQLEGYTDRLAVIQKIILLEEELIKFDERIAMLKSMIAE